MVLQKIDRHTVASWLPISFVFINPTLGCKVTHIRTVVNNAGTVQNSWHRVIWSCIPNDFGQFVNYFYVRWLFHLFCEFADCQFARDQRTLIRPSGNAGLRIETALQILYCPELAILFINTVGPRAIDPLEGPQRQPIGTIRQRVEVILSADVPVRSLSAPPRFLPLICLQVQLFQLSAWDLRTTRGYLKKIGHQIESPTYLFEK